MYSQAAYTIQCLQWWEMYIKKFRNDWPQSSETIKPLSNTLYCVITSPLTVIRVQQLTTVLGSWSAAGCHRNTISFLFPVSTLDLIGSKLKPFSLHSLGLSKTNSQDLRPGSVDFIHPTSTRRSTALYASPRFDWLLNSNTTFCITTPGEDLV